MPDIRLTPAAFTDLEAIADYTAERHGIAQALAYRDGLLKAIGLLSDNPRLGADQSRILPNMRRLVHESHRIYYEIGEAEILILRILGPGQDPTRHLT